MPRTIMPEQAALKAAIRAHLERNTHVLLGDIARACCLDYARVYYWLNGRTLNMREGAGLDALRRWVQEHCHE